MAHRSKQPCFLKCFYQRLAKRKGAQVAAVATARKLLGEIYIMLTEHLEFGSLRVNGA